MASDELLLVASVTVAVFSFVYAMIELFRTRALLDEARRRSATRAEEAYRAGFEHGMTVGTTDDDAVPPIKE